MDWDNFFRVHDGLPRQGPGTAQDVAWACDLANLGHDARICDAACGTGGDIAPLRAAAPGAEILAIEKRDSFVDFARERCGDMPGVSVAQGDMAHLPGPFDMIWCAGALYFLGLEAGLATMRNALAARGVLAFSEPAFFTDTPTAAARDFWEGYPARTEQEITDAVTAAGYEVLGTRSVSDAGWEAYFEPMAAKVVALRPEADAALSEVLDYCGGEGARWRAVKDETGYLLVVARKR